MKKEYQKFLVCTPEEVKVNLQKQDIMVDMIEISPPNAGQGMGKKRVIAIKKMQVNKVKIIWSYENYK